MNQPPPPISELKYWWPRLKQQRLIVYYDANAPVLPRWIELAREIKSMEDAKYLLTPMDKNDRDKAIQHCRNNHFWKQYFLHYEQLDEDALELEYQKLSRMTTMATTVPFG